MAAQNINFTIQLTPEDYIQAVRLHMRPRPAIKRIGYFLLALVVFVLVTLPYFVITRREGRQEGSFLLVALVVILAYLALIFMFFHPRRIKKIFRQQKSLQSLHSYTAMDEEVFIKSPTSEEKLPWDHFTKWKEGKNLFVLYLSDVMFHIIPKRSFAAPEEIIQFRQLLQTKLGSAGI